MEMMAVMSHVATPSAIRDKNPNKISDDLVLVCEEQIDALSAKMEDNGYFYPAWRLFGFCSRSWPVRSYAVPNAVCGR